MPSEADKPQAKTNTEAPRSRCGGWLLPHGAFDHEDQIFIRQRAADMKDAEKSKLDAEKALYVNAKANQIRAREQIDKNRSVPKGIVRRPRRSAPENDPAAMQNGESNKKPRVRTENAAESMAPAEKRDEDGGSAAPAEAAEKKQNEPINDQGTEGTSSVLSGLGGYGSDSS